MYKVAAIQMTSSTDRENNFQIADQLIQQAVTNGAKLIVLPEDFAFMGQQESDRLALAETPGSGPIQSFLAKQARQHGIWLVGGTIPLQTKTPGKIHSACLVFDDTGEQRARYDKIHLFDVEVADQKRHYRESRHTQAGAEITVLATPFGKLGLAICYDLRFPELFRAQVACGAEIFAIPAAFTAVTGQAHWEVLLRARAIENLVYVIAAAQGGIHQNDRETYGHSMVIEPWGKIAAEGSLGPQVVLGTLDLEQQKILRQQFPVLAHRQIASNT
jgi:nitrilase